MQKILKTNYYLKKDTLVQHAEEFAEVLQFSWRRTTDWLKLGIDEITKEKDKASAVHFFLQITKVMEYRHH